MITIDPYEMILRFTYDISKWMSINETITAAYYDYKDSVYHLFFDHNRYYTWTVNVTFQNGLPMSWVRWVVANPPVSQPSPLSFSFSGSSLSARHTERTDEDQPRLLPLSGTRGSGLATALLRTLRAGG